jgi:hypothetical protein
MAEKQKKTAKPAIKPKTDAELAGLLTSPSVQASMTLVQWQPEPDIDINAILDKLSTQIDKVNAGDMKRPEAMLLMQAHTLDGLFNNLARKAQIQTLMPHFESFLRLALKAQSQCRSTLETLATIKNPPVIYAKQANISNGHQQINNGTPPPSQAEKNIIQPNELLEAQHGGTALDTGTTGTAIQKNKAMATLE